MYPSRKAAKSLGSFNSLLEMQWQRQYEAHRATQESFNSLLEMLELVEF